jgi:acetyl-CoA carboxylase biotin carboxyl carrier protein
MSGERDLTHDEVTRILRIVDEAEDVEVRIECGAMKLHVRKGAAGAAAEATPAAAPAPVREAPEPAPAPEAPAAPPAGSALPAGTVAVTAPMMGRFFRAPSPTEPPFVEPGGRVGPEDTVCLLEVMKLFSSVKAGVAGTVEAVLAENEAMVEEGQPLLAIRPD